MSKEQKSDNFKKWGITAFLVYLASLPILIWKNSKIGGILFFFFLIGVLSYGITKLSNSVMTAYYTAEYHEKKKSIEDHFDKAELELEQFKQKIAVLESGLRQKAQEAIDNEVKKNYRDIQDYYGNKKNELREIDRNIKEVQEAIEVIKEKERAAIKERLFSINEKVKVLHKSVDTVEIRSELELVASNIELLAGDERRRLYDELEELGFNIKERRGYYTQGDNLIMTADTIYFSDSEWRYR